MEAQTLPRTGRLFLPRSANVLRAFSDERLVDQVRRGNEQAFEAVYDRHHRGILSFCRHMLGSAEEAEDAVQQTFISAYDALGADRRDIRLKPWLYAIARNRCLSIIRARREQPAELYDVPTAGLSEEVQQRAELRELLARRPASCPSTSARRSSSRSSAGCRTPRLARSSVATS